MYIYHKTYQKSSHICECENRSLLLKGCQRGQKSVLTELDWANPRQSSETAGARGARGGSRSLSSLRRNQMRSGRVPYFCRGGCSRQISIPFFSTNSAVCVKKHSALGRTFLLNGHFPHCASVASLPLRRCHPWRRSVMIREET